MDASQSVAADASEVFSQFTFKTTHFSVRNRLAVGQSLSAQTLDSGNHTRIR